MFDLVELRKTKKIAVLAPCAWRTPPRHYGAWETVASNMTEGLVRRGWNVTLFATKDSITKAKLHAVIDRGYEEDKKSNPKVSECLHISEAFERAGEFDLIHNHFDFLPLTYSRLVSTPVVTTVHGFSSPSILAVYEKYGNGYFVSISDADRAPGINYLATVYNGIDISNLTYREKPGDKLVFLGRIHPDKGVELAIEVAKQSGRDLIIAGIIQDERYFNDLLKSHIDGRKIRYIGPVGPPERDKLLAKAYALLHLNTLPERFGLVMVEAMACGVPVIAMDRGSCREVIKDKETGFLVKNVNEALKALDKVPSISRTACRKRVEDNFTIDRMTSRYEEVYRKIFELEDKGA